MSMWLYHNKLGWHMIWLCAEPTKRYSVYSKISVKCRGFRRIGAPFWMSFLAVFVVHGTFSYWTCPTWIPDPSFGIYTDKIHRVCIHVVSMLVEVE